MKTDWKIGDKFRLVNPDFNCLSVVMGDTSGVYTLTRMAYTDLYQFHYNGRELNVSTSAIEPVDEKPSDTLKAGDTVQCISSGEICTVLRFYRESIVLVKSKETNLEFWAARGNLVAYFDDDIEVTPAGGKHSKLDTRCDLLPAKALLEVAKVLKVGADKYGEDNWRSIDRKGHMKHAVDHILQYLAGTDTSEPHLSHAACRLLFAMETE